MRQAGLAGISPRTAKGFTRRDPDADLAPDLVQRDFTAPALGEGPLWLSAIRDAFSRRVVACRVFATRAEANLALFEYIDGFYNLRPIQKRLGYLSPIELEEKYYADQATAEPVNLKPRQPARTS